MTKRERIEEVISNLYDYEIIEMWNEYCDNNGYYDDKVFAMSEVDDVVFYDKDLSLETVQWLQDNDFDPTDDYFAYDGYDIETFCDIYDKVNEGELADYIEDNDDPLGNDEIEEILEEEDEDEDEEGEEEE